MYHSLTVIEDAVEAAQRIPEEMSATQAACQFLEHTYKDAPQTQADPPTWFFRS